MHITHNFLKKEVKIFIIQNVQREGVQILFFGINIEILDNFSENMRFFCSRRHKFQNIQALYSFFLFYNKNF